jgi:hypothetical protein
MVSPSRAFRFFSLPFTLAIGACSIINSYDDVVSGVGSGGSGGGEGSGASNGSGAESNGGDGNGAGAGGSGATSNAGTGPGAQANGGFGGGGQAPLTLETFLDEFPGAMCTRVLYCESKLGFGAILEIMCHPSFGRFFVDQFNASGAFAETFDPEEAQNCLDALSIQDCSVYNTFGAEECQFVFEPKLNASDTCINDEDCIDGYCEYSSPTCGGTCIEAPGDQEDCSEHDCKSGFYCDGTNTCLPIGQLGDTCGESNECDATLWCPVSSLECEALPDLGDFCETDFGGDPCRGSLVCNDSTPPGECMEGQDEEDPCDYDLPCKPGMRCSSVSDTCVPLSPPGGPCESSQNCPAGGFECVANECVALPVIGEDCDAILTCISGTCDPVTDTCVEIETGEECDGGNGTGPFASACEGYCIDNPEYTGEPDPDPPFICGTKNPDGTPCDDDWECEDGTKCLGVDGEKECVTCP